MKRSNKIRLRTITVLVGLIYLLFRPSVSAHEPSKSYLNLSLDSGRFTGQWDISLRDLATIVRLDLDQHGSVNSDQLKAQYADAVSYAFSHLQILLDAHAIAPRLTSPKPIIEKLSDGDYLELTFDLAPVLSPRTLTLKYSLFFETNSLHRGLVRVEVAQNVQVAAFSPGHATQTFQLGSSSPVREFFAFLREGVFHIWTGYDHILFLLSLLLPSVLQRDAHTWRPIGALRPAFFNVLKIVTAFTLAHSLTLGVAAVGLIRLPSRLTESAIALSVALAAANNLWPLVRERGWMVAFGFGLIHGFGFANALSDLGLAHAGLFSTLIAFNLGVEIGQLAIVAVFLPVAFAARGAWFYRVPILQFGSAAIVLIAVAWCAERVLAVKFMPF